MRQSELHETAVEFFDAFVEAFRTFSGPEVASRYLVPYLARHRDGTMTCFVSLAEVAGYFQDVLDTYHGRGCRTCRYEDLGVLASVRRAPSPP